MYFPPPSEEDYDEPHPKRMCGDGRIEKVNHKPGPPFQFRSAYVRFTNGAFTKWHCHTGEQLLVATEGKGFVQFQGLAPQTLEQFDRIFIPAGVWHRHGARDGETFLHLAVTCGKTEWDEDDSCEKPVFTFADSDSRSN